MHIDGSLVTSASDARAPRTLRPTITYIEAETRELDVPPTAGPVSCLDRTKRMRYYRGNHDTRTSSLFQVLRLSAHSNSRSRPFARPSARASDGTCAVPQALGSPCIRPQVPSDCDFSSVPIPRERRICDVPARLPTAALALLRSSPQARMHTRLARLAALAREARSLSKPKLQLQLQTRVYIIFPTRTYVSYVRIDSPLVLVL
ncbi:hypothetical protein C8Q73DRAFT_217101 [Cubamyces lactineus]|nr:hypothetical protein C8Q73DRAFT_217101 [Cubamyces lactineus]